MRYNHKKYEQCSHKTWLRCWWQIQPDVADQSHDCRHDKLAVNHKMCHRMGALSANGKCHVVKSQHWELLLLLLFKDPDIMNSTTMEPSDTYVLPSTESNLACLQQVSWCCTTQPLCGYHIQNMLQYMCCVGLDDPPSSLDMSSCDIHVFRPSMKCYKRLEIPVRWRHQNSGAMEYLSQCLYSFTSLIRFHLNKSQIPNFPNFVVYLVVAWKADILPTLYFSSAP